MEGFKFIDLFSGLGGFHIALSASGGQCVFASDIDVPAQKTYYENFGIMPDGDITKIDEKNIPDHDIVAAGFPCQAFSIAGKRRGFEDTRGTLFFDVARIIKEKRPKGFILENVAGLVSHDSGRTIQVIEKTLDELGYVYAWKLLNAKDYGVPQNRNRWYCVGVRDDIAKERHITEELLLTDIFPESEELSFFVEDVLEDEVDDIDRYSISEVASRNIQSNLPDFLDRRGVTKHPIIANNIRPSKVSFSNSGVFPCLTAKMGTGGNNVPVIVELDRKITVREGLRIMGFPDTYVIPHRHSQAYKQIGNSIVVPVATKISSNLVAMIADF